MEFCVGSFGFGIVDLNPSIIREFAGFKRCDCHATDVNLRLCGLAYLNPKGRFLRVFKDPYKEIIIRNPKKVGSLGFLRTPKKVGLSGSR